MMTPEHRAQMRRLAQFHESARTASDRAALNGTSTPPSTSAGSTSRAAQANGENGVVKRSNDGNGEDNGSDDDSVMADRNQTRDPLIFPGVYAPSGIDMMKILIRVRLRPNPTIDLGFVDDSCALVLCDILAPDAPIVYCSEPFSLLTGYESSEVLGRNCRFLQSPDGKVSPGDKRLHTDEESVYELKTRITMREETQISLTNYKKGGERFENILTTIPLRWDSDSAEIRYFVGFQVDRQKCFLP